MGRVPYLGVIERICAGNNLPTELFRDGSKDNVSALITASYRVHRRNGGAPDPVEEDLIEEVRLEDAAGQYCSLHPAKPFWRV
jgi:hypothetical protein